MMTPDRQEAPRDRANRTQLEASDPAVSAFVAASAGSGKTKLLTDRLLRLMLTEGTKPERIQCLTFTKAAAAEMSVRLQRLLGAWVTKGDAELDQELIRLAIVPDRKTRDRARALFAQVLDLPGGMRIGTIHAFCQSLLRRFPLEAAVSPHFQVVADRDADDALTEARETMLSAAGEGPVAEALETLAGLASLSHFANHVDALRAGADRYRVDLSDPGIAGRQRRVLGVRARSEADIMEAAVNWQAEPALRDAARISADLGAKTVAERAANILGWLGLDTPGRIAAWHTWTSQFLTGKGEIRAQSAFVSKSVTTRHPDLQDIFLAEAERVRGIESERRALKAAEISAALLTLAIPVLRAYGAHKERSGLLDYADLIVRTSALLIDPGAAWVLYKLDGGLDHLLLDEVQDIAPGQWHIAHALTGEFFAGEGARDVRRTVFAVGDRKQSIFGFQGADVSTFEEARTLLARRVGAADETWRDLTLDVSFRSTRPVLDLVDAVFRDPDARRGVVTGEDPLTHFADRAGHAGTVELWPLAPPPEDPPVEAWAVPAANQGQTTASRLLAERLAEWIRGQTDGTVMLESQGRPLAAGDVMILVRRREAFAHAVVRALKARGVPVAGMDRMVLTDQPAVQDLMTLCDVLLLPDDDLSFACYLTSPLGGLNDDDLMALAVGRRGSLADALRVRAGENQAWGRAWSFFAALLARVDYASPFALLAEALGALGGRARLLARLGPEAAEPIAELLNAAQSYTAIHPPSLQGFLHWMRRSGAEVKREAEAAGGLVRVMTVHGAKGLQAPVVIMPDTTALPTDRLNLSWAEDPSGPGPVPVWVPSSDQRFPAIDAIRAREDRLRIEEHNRLLYVALTRAEDRLIVCGWRPRKAVPPGCWYDLVERGFRQVPAERVPFGHWEGDLVRLSSPQTAVPETRRTAVEAAGATDPPPWTGGAPDWRPAPPPPEPARPEPLAPSRPDGVELGPVPASASPLSGRLGQGDRFRRGQLIHGLLQHLADLPAGSRAGAAFRYLDRPGHGLPRDATPSIVAEIMGILDHPVLAPLFGVEGRAEVPLTGLVGGSVVGGVVDRLAVLPDRVLLADFKTNRRPPATVEDTPVLYLRQMAVYRAVLRAIFPDRPVICALVWTRDAQVSVLPEERLAMYEPRSGVLSND
jgi:ATP-dependent helicase/nuclease subunit A